MVPPGSRVAEPALACRRGRPLRHPPLDPLILCPSIACTAAAQGLLCYNVVVEMAGVLGTSATPTVALLTGNVASSSLLGLVVPFVVLW